MPTESPLIRWINTLCFQLNNSFFLETFSNTLIDGPKQLFKSSRWISFWILQFNNVERSLLSLCISLSLSVCLSLSLFQSKHVVPIRSLLFFYSLRSLGGKIRIMTRRDHLCSSDKSIFSRESMLPPSDSTTHWPVSRQSALIPSSFQELFFLALFGSRPAEQRAQDQQRRKTSLL